VNHLTRGLADYNFQTKHDATSQTAQWLAGELGDLRKQSEDLQTKVALAQRESGVVTLGGVDALGREQLYSTVLDKLQQATAAYTKAESDRIEKGAVYEVAKTGDAEAISSLTSNPMFAGSSNMDSALSLIQGLRMEKATLKAQLAEAQAKFGPAYPKLAEMQKHADSIDEAIHTEVQRVTERAKNDYDVAQQIEENTRKIYSDQKRQADALNDKTIGYTILRQEADESRTLYESLFKQLKQAGILAGFRSNNISIVDPARVPAKPARPKVLLYLAASLFGGLFMGCFGAFLRDGLDNKIHDLPALEGQLGQMPIGILPFHKETRYLKGSGKTKRNRSGTVLVLTDQHTLPRSSEVIDAKLPSINPAAGQFPALTDPRSQYTEAVRALRTSLLLSRGGAPPKVILITSSVAGEGKSMLSLNLAALFAQQGKKALLIDADLRRPTLHRKLNVNAKEGLSSLLADHRGEAEILAAPIETSDVPGLWLLSAGPPPPFPAELLGSPQMRDSLQLWRKHFDFIVIDGCPVLPVTDSVVLSTIADFTVLVARYKLTNRNSLERSYQLLNSQDTDKNTGIVLNAVTRTANSYYQYYGYRNSGYYAKEEHYAQKSS
jgi:capsular exopolysaccharide synthesis family protein